MIFAKVFIDIMELYHKQYSLPTIYPVFLTSCHHILVINPFIPFSSPPPAPPVVYARTDFLPKAGYDIAPCRFQ